MSTRSFFWASPLLCAALFVACAEERTVAPSVTPPSFSSQGAPTAPAAFRFYQQHNLLSDGPVAADRVHPNLVNACGLVPRPATSCTPPTSTPAPSTSSTAISIRST